MKRKSVTKQQVTRAIIYAAGWDEGNRSMAKAGRAVWSYADWNRAARRALQLARASGLAKAEVESVQAVVNAIYRDDYSEPDVSDLHNKLRVWTCVGDTGGIQRNRDLMLQASDRIRELEAAVTKLNENIDDYEASCDRKDARIAHLEAALHEIADFSEQFIADDDAMYKVNQIADTALAPDAKDGSAVDREAEPCP